MIRIRESGARLSIRNLAKMDAAHSQIVAKAHPLKRRMLGLVARAVFDGTYGAVIGEIREEVKAEWKKAGHQPPGQEDAAEPDGEAAVMRLITEPDVVPLAKIRRPDRLEAYIFFFKFYGTF
jgi:hypothetical protein